jgi:hypothetical protein
MKTIEEAGLKNAAITQKIIWRKSKGTSLL